MNRKLTKINTIDDLKKALNITDLRNMKAQGVLELVSNIHKLDPEVAKELLKHYPEYKGAVTETVTQMKQAMESVLAKDSENNQAFFESENHKIELLIELTKDETLSDELKIRVFDLISEINDEIKERNAQSFELKQLGLKILGFLGLASIMSLGIIYHDHSRIGKSEVTT